MSIQSKIIVYTTTKCPNCKILKDILTTNNIQYTEENMSAPKGLTELRMNNVFAMSAPVLQIDNKFYTTKELCNTGTLDQNKVKTIVDIISGSQNASEALN